MTDPKSDVLNMALDKIDTLTAQLVELSNSTTSDHIAAKYWKQRQNARNETRRVTDERDAALAVIEEAKESLKKPLFLKRVHEGFTVDDYSRPLVEANPLHAVLEQSPTVALAKVRAGALRKAADSRNGEVKEWLNWRAEQIEKQAPNV